MLNYNDPRVRSLDATHQTNFNASFQHVFSYPHLAKLPSDLKQNGTQEKTPFSGTVFHTLSHGVVRFVESVSFKSH